VSVVLFCFIIAVSECTVSEGVIFPTHDTHTQVEEGRANMREFADSSSNVERGALRCVACCDVWGVCVCVVAVWLSVCLCEALYLPCCAPEQKTHKQHTMRERERERDVWLAAWLPACVYL